AAAAARSPAGPLPQAARRAARDAGLSQGRPQERRAVARLQTVPPDAVRTCLRGAPFAAASLRDRGRPSRRYSSRIGWFVRPSDEETGCSPAGRRRDDVVVAAGLCPRPGRTRCRGRIWLSLFEVFWGGGGAAAGG